MAATPPGWSARQGLLTASSVLFAVAAGAALGLQDLWWAAISAWIVAMPDFVALWRKAAMRVIGTAAGLALGMACAVSIEGLPAAQALALFAVCALGTYLRFSSRYGYAWFYGSITFMLMLTVSIVEPGALFDFAQFRFAEISCGVLSSAFVHALAKPRAQGPAMAAPPAAPAGDLDLMHLAMVGGVSALGMVLLWSWSDLPSMPQAVGSCLAVLDRDFGGIRVKARQRLLGCALGAGLGLAALAFELDSFLVYGAVLFAGIFYFSRLHNGGGAQTYMGTQGGVAFITAMVTGSGAPSELQPVAERLGGIFAGVVLMVAVSYLLAAIHRRPAPPDQAGGERQTAPAR